MPMMFPPPRRSGAWVLVVLLAIALVISIVVNVVLLGMAMSSATEQVKQTVLAGEGPQKIAVVPVEGLIDEDSSVALDRVLKEVEKDSQVKALVVQIDTPGGSASAAEEMYHRLNQFKSEQHMPVVVAMQGMATSGGYYLACAGDYIFAEPGCMTGNIGVLFPRFNVSKLMDKWGLAETTLTATVPGHSYKNAGSMFQPQNPLDEKYLQGLVDGTFALFKDAVETGRKGKLIGKYGDIFSGKAFLATDARDRGLIDQIGYPDKAYDYAASLANVSNPLVVEFAPRPTLLQLLQSRSNVQRDERGASSALLSINGLSIDAKAAEDLLTARPMLLWRGN